jgi:hypothetical protein
MSGGSAWANVNVHAKNSDQSSTASPKNQFAKRKATISFKPTQMRSTKLTQLRGVTQSGTARQSIDQTPMARARATALCDQRKRPLQPEIQTTAKKTKIASANFGQSHCHVDRRMPSEAKTLTAIAIVAAF